MIETPDIPCDPSQEIIIPADELSELMVRMLKAKGMYEAEARIGASRLIEADLRGIHSHGSRSLWRYLEAMDTGGIDARAQVLVECETPAMAVLNAGKGLGHVGATRGMQLAIEKARAVGTGTVAIGHGQHYGSAAVYALMAVEAGMIGFTTTSTGPATVAAYGSRNPGTANNAVAWGVPTRSGAPFVLDMACGVSAWGKVESLKMYGRELPEGWALDAGGNLTLDPASAKTLLPFAGARLRHGLSLLGACGGPGRRADADAQDDLRLDRGLGALFLRHRHQTVRGSRSLLQRAGINDGRNSRVAAGRRLRPRASSRRAGMGTLPSLETGRDSPAP